MSQCRCDTKPTPNLGDKTPSYSLVKLGGTYHEKWNIRRFQ